MAGIAVGLVLVVGVVFGGIVLLRDGGETSESARAELASVPAKPPWGKKATITQADLRKVKPIELWARMFKAQAMQPVWRIKTMRYFTPEPKQSLEFTNEYSLSQVAINFGAKQWSFSREKVYIEGDKQSRSLYRCVDGDVYWYVPGARPLRSESSARVPCTPKDVKYSFEFMWLTDGISIGGLSAKQASAFVGGLLTWEGVNESFKGHKLITVDKPKLVNHDGKQYVRLVVLPSIPIGSGFRIAFNKTGLDKQKYYPYDNIGEVDRRMLMIYYVDPATMLPAYAEFHATKSNAELEQGSYIHHRVEYKFGGKIPQPTVDRPPPQPIELSWPPEQLSNN